MRVLSLPGRLLFAVLPAAGCAVAAVVFSSSATAGPLVLLWAAVAVAVWSIWRSADRPRSLELLALWLLVTVSAATLDALPSSPMSSVAVRLLFAVGALLFLVSLFSLVTCRHRLRDSAALVEAGVVGCALVAVLFAFLTGPLSAVGRPLPELLLVAAAPVLSAVSLLVVARLLLTDPRQRPPGLWALAVTAALHFAHAVTASLPNPPAAVAAPVLVGAAALAATLLFAPDRTMFDPVTPSSLRLSSLRLHLLTFSALVPIGLLVVFALSGAASAAQMLLFALCAMVAVALSGWRLTGLVAWSSEVARIEHESRFAALTSQGHDVVAVIDDQSRIEFVSPALSRFWALRADEAVGLPLTSLACVDDMALVEQAVAYARSKPLGESVLVEFRSPSLAVFEASIVRVAGGGVDGLVVAMRDVSERARLEDDLRRQAFSDPLTGLANRAMLYQFLHGCVDAGFDVGVMLLDLDEFKAVNDGPGHDVGDELLRQIAGRLLACVRPGDLVARLGGDEFAIATHVSALADISQRVVAETVRPVDALGFSLRVSASVGAAAGFPGAKVEELLRRADIAMYAAKRAGKNRWREFDALLSAEVESRLSLKLDLEAALASNSGLRVAYQPICELISGETVGFEALLRWWHPQRGEVPALDVVGLAEEYGLIGDIGRFVLTEAVSTFSLVPSVFVSVNVSGRQLSEPDLVPFVDELLRTHRFDPARLVLELTESFLVKDPDVAAARIEQLRALGVVFVLDDFGTMYSSLSYLHRFAFDKLKIDASFVREVTRRPSHLLAAIVSMAAAMQLDVVAEGVETPAQRQLLIELGCRFGQGWLFGPAAERHELFAAFPAPAAGCQVALPAFVPVR